jgi:hypothetical protein
VDESGNIYVTGYFRHTADFDPGPGVDEHTAFDRDAFVCKFNSAGEFQWARTWGGSEEDIGFAIITDSIGGVYVAGRIDKSIWPIDLDPGPGVDEHNPLASNDAYLSKFDSNGNYIWARTWGGLGQASGSSVAIDGFDSIYVSGHYRNTVDFDPGAGIDEHTSVDEYDVYITKFQSSGSYQSVLVWGGEGHDKCSDITIDVLGNLYATGHFEETCDFDPGTAEVERDAGQSLDAYLSKFDSSGNFAWVRTWGGDNYYDDCLGEGLTADGSGNVYVIGDFEGTMDFDPGGDADEHTSNGGFDVFFSKFDTNGEFQWCNTWGEDYDDYGYSVAEGGSDFIYLATGRLRYGVYKFDTGGNQIWERAFTGNVYSGCYDVVIDKNEDIYVAGSFWYPRDFDPGPCRDVHVPNGLYDIFLWRILPNGYWW